MAVPGNSFLQRCSYSAAATPGTWQSHSMIPKQQHASRSPPVRSETQSWTLQAALDARIMRPEEVRAAVRESADLGQWLGNKVHKLFATPIEIVAFSDEEGVR